MKAIDYLEDPGTPLSSGELEAYEKENDLVLDESVKRLLGRVNGGGWNYTIVSFRTHGLFVEIKGLCCALRGNLWDIASCIASARDGRSETITWTPFAHTVGGDYFVALDGEIFLWDHETDELQLVESDLSRFLDSLFIDSI